MFEALDLNGDGKISRAEFIRTIRSSAEIAKVTALESGLQIEGRQQFSLFYMVQYLYCQNLAGFLSQQFAICLEFSRFGVLNFDIVEYSSHRF